MHVFEGAAQVGGRVRTERVGGFLLDRGFHLLHTAYPEFRHFVDVKRLRVKPVYNGALVRFNGDFSLLANPGRQFADILSTFVAGNANWKDKLKMVRLLAEANAVSEDNLLSGGDITALEYFQARGFSEKFINSFFKPFLASTFLDNDLSTPSRLALFVFKMFSKGMVGLPEKGIGALPEQIASKLQEGTVHLQSKVKKVSGAGIQLLKGDFITADRVLIATSPLALPELLPDYHTDLDSRHVTCLYFAADTAPVSKPVVVLNGEDKGLVNNLCVVDRIQPSYAPEGNHLVAVHVTRPHELDDEELIDEVLKEMAGWFGVKVNTWEHLKTYHIKYARPCESKPDDRSGRYAAQYSDTVFICGDHLSYGSMNAAIRSGREAADLLHKSLKSAKKSRPVQAE